MGKMMMNDIPYGSTFENATSIKYSNTKSGMNAINIQDAVDEIVNNQNDTDNNLSQLSNPNLLINGDFQVWQRGTEFDLTPLAKYQYLADRWCTWVNSGYEVSKIDGGGIQLLPTLYQFLETKLKVGEDYTLSANIDGIVYQMSIVGGEYIENEYFMYNLHSSGKHDCIGVKSNDEVRTIYWVKLEQGTIATPFVSRLYAEELMLCQRYYYKVGDLDFVGFSGVSGNIYIPIAQIMNMRDSITVSYNFTTFHVLNGDGNKISCNVLAINKVYHNEIAIISDNKNYNIAIGVGLQNGDEINLDAEIY